MEQKLQNLLDELERAGAANDTLETDRSRKMLNLESDTARLIAILARATSATRRGPRDCAGATSNPHAEAYAARLTVGGQRPISPKRNCRLS